MGYGVCGCVQGVWIFLKGGFCKCWCCGAVFGEEKEKSVSMLRVWETGRWALTSRAERGGEENV